MRNIEYWTQRGFRFEVRFSGEYDLWINPGTTQRLRRYANGYEELSDLYTGAYQKVEDE